MTPTILSQLEAISHTMARPTIVVAMIVAAAVTTVLQAPGSDVLVGAAASLATNYVTIKGVGKTQ